MLARTGLVLGAATLGFAQPLAAAPRQRRGGFDTGRRDVYVALVTTVVGASSAQWAADQLAADYKGRPADTRRAIDGVLDALDKRGFARMNDRGRKDVLRDWERNQAELAVHAATLATLPFTPAPESEDDVIKPVPVVL